MEFRTCRRHWGAEFISDDVVRFRVWAEGQKDLTLRLTDTDIPMAAVGDGWFQIDVPGVRHGTTYQFVLQDGMAVPDPASRAQQSDVNGPSVVIDPRRSLPTQREWQGRPWEETVIYELHIGTFTGEGTFRAAIGKLPYLAELGITQLEVMPVSQFGGARGWGYDGVLLYAPHSAYGTPDDFHAFIDAAHALGLSVVLDIVLNHFGPEGNYLPLLSPAFFHQDRMTPWGNGIAYEVEAVRQYIAEAPLFWLSEYHLDGLRFDAIDQIHDGAETHILPEIAQRIRDAFPDRHIHLTTEDSRNVIFLHPRDEHGQAPLFTAEWNDDFHNAAHVFATGESHAYYQDFAFEPEKKLARALAVTLGLLAVTVALWLAGNTLSGAAMRNWLTWPQAQSLAAGWVLLWLITFGAALWTIKRPGLVVGIALALASMALSWLMRWTLLMEGQTLPKYNALFNPYSLPSGTDGLLAIVGTFGLWIALLILVCEIVHGLLRRNHHA